MRITTLEEYGIRCALRLARVYGQGPVSASHIAKLEGISAEYVGKILFLLRKAGVVHAERGTQGGFFLTREPKTIALKTLTDALTVGTLSNASPKDEHFCGHFSGNLSECVHRKEGECAIRPVWSLLLTYFDEVLAKLTLADLLQQEKVMHHRVDQFASVRARDVLDGLKSPL